MAAASARESQRRTTAIRLNECPGPNDPQRKSGFLQRSHRDPTRPSRLGGRRALPSTPISWNPCDRVMVSIQSAALFLTLPLAGLVQAQASLAGPRLFPSGARAPGIQETVLDAPTGSYLFTLKSLSGATIVQYRLPLRHPNMVAGVLRIEETTTGIVPIAGGGLTYRNTVPGASNVGTVLSAYDLAFSPATDPVHGATLLSHSYSPVTGIVSVRFRDGYLVNGARINCEKLYEVRLVGKSLEIRATSDFAVRSDVQYNHAGFAFGGGEGLQAPALAFHVPYMDSIPVYVSAGGHFVSRVVDWYRSGSSDGISTATPSVTGTTFQGETAPTYYKNDFGELNAPIDEVVYVTVSNSVADVMPVVDRAPSAYRMHLADRAVSQAAPGALYTSNQAWVARAQSLGMSDMAHIKWDWSKWPFNLNDPDLLPAAGVPCGTIWGTTADWLSYTLTAARGNWTFAPYFLESSNDPGYQNQVLQLPGSLPGSVILTPNPAYNATFSVRDALGVAKGGWNTEANLAGTNLGGQTPPVGHPVEVLGAHLRSLHLTAAANAIHGLGGYTAFPVAGAHTDAAAGIGDWNEIDQRKNSGFPKTVAENLKWREVSFSALKDGLDGPLFGENSHWRHKAFETFNAGLLDGTSRKIPINWNSGPPDAENKDYYVVPDFELNEVVTKATGFFGMGWESHFSNAGPWGFDDAFVDAWHATLLSYGHAPYFGTNGDVPNNYWDWRRNIRSYYLCYGVSAAMRSSRIQEVRYEDTAGVERTLAEALLQVPGGAMDLSKPRLVLRFTNQLEFKANHSNANWSTTVRGTAYVIPPNGFVAAGTNGLLALSAINPSSGARVDYAYNPGHSQIIDRRTVNQSFNGFPGALLPVPVSLTQFNGASDQRMVIVHDLRQNRAIYGAGLIEGSVGLGPVPAPMSLTVAIDDTDTLSAGRPRIGVRAILTDGLGNKRDVTGQCTWVSSNPAVVQCNRFGGLSMQGVGSAVVTATWPSSGFVASRTIQATRAPVLTPVKLEAVSNNRAFLSFTTDAACRASVQLRNVATGAIVTLAGRPDPAQKVHQFAFRNLSPLTTYEATPIAQNGGGFITTGTAFVFTTL